MWKKVVSVLILCACVAPTPVFAARLWTSGFELNSCTANVEVITCNFTSDTAGTISSTQKHSGTYSFRANPSGSSRSVGEMQFSSAGIGVTYARFYIYVVSYPGSNDTLSYISNASDNTLGGVFMNSSGQLGIEYRTSPSNQAYGTTLSSALSLNTWYRVEYLVDSSTVNQQVVTLRLDGTQIDSVTGTRTIAANSNQVMLWGAYLEGVESGAQDVYIDDIAINDTSGASQTSYPGAGNVVLALPNAAGDNSCDIGDYSMINEIPPSDTATTGSTMCELNTTTSIGDFNATDSTGLGIDSFDTISLVDLIVRVREASAGTSNYTLRVKSASGGSVSASGAVDAGNATARTNPNSTTSFINRLVSYTDPTTGTAWTPTGTNSIDNMQIGAATTDGSPATWVLGLYGMVEYVDGVAPGATVRMRARLQNASFKLNGGRFILQSN